MTPGPSRGLPPRTYLPILLVTMLAFLGVIGYFLKIGLGVTGAALGPSVAGDTTQAGSGVGMGESGPSGVGGGTPAQIAPGGPPPMVQRLLVELRGRVAHDPNDVRALASLASLYIDAGKYAQATRYYERALAVSPNDAEALFDRGTVEGAAGHRASAIAAFRKFLRVAPSDARASDARDAIAKLGA